MKNQKLDELSDEQLLKKQKLSKAITFMLAGSLALMSCVSIASIIMKDFRASSILPIALLPILIVNINNLKEIEEEIKTRNLGS